LAALLQDVGVDHGGGHIVVPEQLLNGADVGAAWPQVGGECVPTLIVTLLIMRRWRRSGPRTIPFADNR
jgi:hypothetical protein